MDISASVGAGERLLPGPRVFLLQPCHMEKSTVFAQVAKVP